VEARIVNYRSLGQLDAGQLRSVQVIYEEAFHASTRDSFERLVEVDDAADRLHMVMLDVGEPLGFAFLSCLRAVPWMFLEYFAVEESHRDGGLGGVLWDAVWGELAARKLPQRMVLELKDPADPGSHPDERATRERRIRFYARRDARRLPVPRYVVPDLSGPGVLRLLLYAVTRSGDPLPSGDALGTLVRAVYTEGYGLLPADALVVAALDSLPTAQDVAP
jgi:hypothetical protein